MRTITTTQERVWAARRQRFLPRVEIEDDTGTLQDWTDLYGYDWIQSITVQGEIDVLGRTATIGLHFRRDQQNASPFVTGTQISGWIDMTREVVISVAVVPEDYTSILPQDYIEIFRGTINRYDLKSSPGSIECRDSILAQLADRYVEEEALFGDSATKDIEDVMQDLLTAYTDGSINLESGTSGFAVVEYEQAPMHMIQAMQDLAALNAWDLRSKYDEGNNDWRLFFEQPDRAATATTPFTFETDKQLDVGALELDLADIRNVVKVSYLDSGTEDDGDFSVNSTTQSDAASVAKYGRRWMEIVEGSTSQIDTLTEASNLAVAILSDISEPLVDYTVDVPLFPWVEVNDLVEFEPDGRRLGAAQTLAVFAFEHVIQPDKCTTTLTTSGAPKSGRRNWTDRQAEPGKVRSRGDLEPPDPDAPTITATALANVVKIAWPATGDWDMVALYRGTTSGFAANASTLIAYVRGGQYTDKDVVPGTTYYYKTKTKSRRNGKYGGASAAVAGDPNPVNKTDLADDITAFVRVGLSSNQASSTPGTLTVEFDTVEAGQSALFDASDHEIELQQDGMASLYVKLRGGSGQDVDGWRAEIEDTSTGDILADVDFRAGDRDIDLTALVLVDDLDELRVRVEWSGVGLDIDASVSYFAGGMSALITP